MVITEVSFEEVKKEGNFIYYETKFYKAKNSTTFFDDCHPDIKGKIIETDSVVTAKVLSKHIVKDSSFVLTKRFPPDKTLEAIGWCKMVMNNIPDYVSEGKTDGMW